MTNTSIPPAGRDPLTGALTDVTADQLREADDDLTEEMAVFLAAGGYGSIKEWAEDSDYYYEPLSGEWYSHSHPPGWPGAPPQDIYEELNGAMESALSGLRYQVVVLRVPFDTASRGFDSQGTDLGGQDPPYQWDWTALLDSEAKVEVLDCDPVSEDPDVQMIERLPGAFDVSPLLDEDDGERRCRKCGDSYNVEDHGGAEQDNGYCVTATCQAAAGAVGFDPRQGADH
jgi:hypothetical protein